MALFGETPPAGTAYTETSFARGVLERDNEDIPSIITPAMREWRKCVRCQQEYRQFENIGAWRCLDHVQPYDDDLHRYPCCPASDQRGCQLCDHTQDVTRPYPHCTLPTSGSGFNSVVPAFECRLGNLEELQGVSEFAIQYPENWAERRREHGVRAVVRIYPRCAYGKPH